MSAIAAAPLDVRRFIDERPVSAYQWLIMALCFSVAFIDGFDTSILAYVAPALIESWGISRESLGPMMAAALVGFAAGGFIAGPIGDRYGRKGILIASVLLFGISAIAAAFAHSVAGLSVARVLTGLGCGAAVPNAAAMVAEYSPQRHSALAVSLMFCGYTLGNACAGFAGAALIPLLGWQSMFIIGGGIPIALAIALIYLLPESARFMVAVNRPREQVIATLVRIAPEQRALLETVPHFILHTHARAQVHHPIRTIFSAKLLPGTLILWAVFFSGLICIYLLTSWLPTLLHDSGFSVRASANLTALWQLGGTAGAILIAWLMQKIGPHIAIASSYAIAVVLILVMSQSIDNITVLAICVVATGFFASGAQTPMTALATDFYPTPARSTGLGWMLGVGRGGAITGAYIGGPLLAMGLDFKRIVAALAIPLLIAAVLVATKGIWYSRNTAHSKNETDGNALRTNQVGLINSNNAR